MVDDINCEKQLSTSKFISHTTKNNAHIMSPRTTGWEIEKENE